MAQAGSAFDESIQRRNAYDQRLEDMKQERSSYEKDWSTITDYFYPGSSRIFQTLDPSKGNKPARNIINNTATVSWRMLKSGLMAGITSPARPWFRLSTPDDSVAQMSSVKDWLQLVTVKMQEVFNRSNLYQVLPQVYGSLGMFGTACMYAEEDDLQVIRFYTLTTGSYWLAQNHKQRVDTVYRKFPQSVKQLVDKFGVDNCSEQVKSYINSNQMTKEVEVVHVVEPNNNYNPMLYDNRSLAVRSVYYEYNQGAQTRTAFLRESGYYEFPYMCPRWDVFDESTYGFGPAHECIGDVKALQKMESKSLQALDKWVDPPMMGDDTLKTQRVSTVPGEITYIAHLAQQAHAGLRPIYQVNPDISHVEAKIREHERRISTTMYRDMMQMFAQSDSPQKTAREVEELHQEKLLVLGPVMERLNDELFDQLIKTAYGIMLRRGIVPPPPAELHNHPLKVEYLSIMAQAQKLIGVNGIESIIGFVGQAAQLYPQALDKIDIDAAIDALADMRGVPPKIIRGEDAVEGMREEKAQAIQAQQVGQMAKPLADAGRAAKDFSATDPEKLQQMMQMMTGGAA